MKNLKYKLVLPSKLKTNDFIIINHNIIKFYHILDYDNYKYYMTYFYQDQMCKTLIQKNKQIKLITNA